MDSDFEVLNPLTKVWLNLWIVCSFDFIFFFINSCLIFLFHSQESNQVVCQDLNLSLVLNGHENDNDSGLKGEQTRNG